MDLFDRFGVVCVCACVFFGRVRIEFVTVLDLCWCVGAPLI